MKLAQAVTYTVDNGQVITKEFKNILRKVKKSELNQQGGAQTNGSAGAVAGAGAVAVAGTEGAVQPLDV